MTDLTDSRSQSEVRIQTPPSEMADKSFSVLARATAGAPPGRRRRPDDAAASSSACCGGTSRCVASRRRDRREGPEGDADAADVEDG